MNDTFEYQGKTWQRFTGNLFNVPADKYFVAIEVPPPAPDALRKLDEEIKAIWLNRTLTRNDMLEAGMLQVRAAVAAALEMMKPQHEALEKRVAELEKRSST